MIPVLPLATPPKAICVLRLSAIGDVCHTLAVVRTLQDAWPNTHITWLIGKLEASLLADIPGIEFIVYDKRSGREGLAGLRRSLAGRRFEVLLNMQPSLRALRVARCVKADIHLGFDRARAKDFQWLFTTHRIARKDGQHVLDGLFGFVEALGIRERKLRWDIPLATDHLQFAAQHCPSGSRHLIISPLASEGARGTRNWHPERFAELATYAHREHGLQVILTGGPSERERTVAQLIQSSAGCPLTNLVGQTSLKQLLALIARADVLVCPDSGPGHMATAVGTPVISLFAGTNPARAAPYLSRQWAVNRYLEALRADCGKPVEAVSWGRRVRDPSAMDLITVDEVCRMLDRVMLRGRD